MSENNVSEQVDAYLSVVTEGTSNFREVRKTFFFIPVRLTGRVDRTSTGVIISIEILSSTVSPGGVWVDPACLCEDALGTPFNDWKYFDLVTHP